MFGNALLFEEAIVYGKAVVFGKARVFGKTSIYSGSITSTNDYICIGPIGSRDDFTTFFKNIEEFQKAVEREHSQDIYGK